MRIASEASTMNNIPYPIFLIVLLITVTVIAALIFSNRKKKD